MEVLNKVAEFNGFEDRITLETSVERKMAQHKLDLSEKSGRFFLNAVLLGSLWMNIIFSFFFMF